MSSALAIAGVTGLLRDLLSGVMTDPDLNLSTIVGSTVDVSALPPDLIKSETNGINRLNLFLYQVQPNQGWRNINHPSRDGRGDRIANPPLGLDLYYLLTAYAGADMHAEVLLGYAMQYLHELGVMTREMIRNQFNAWNGSTDPLIKALPGSKLADQIEQIKISPYALNTEEMSKLWTATQAHYRPTAAYHVSVVLIESQYPTRAALPVLTRGDKDQGVDILLGPFPSLEGVYFGMPQDPILQTRPLSLPAAKLGLCVIVAGRNLAAETVLLRFRHSKLDLTQELSVASTDLSSKELKVSLPQPGSGTTQTDWAPGVYIATVVQKQSGSTWERTSNGLPIALSPIIDAIEPGTTIPRDAQGTATITLTCQPRMRNEQQAVLLLAGREIVGQIDTNDANKIVFVVKNAPVVTNEFIRLRVDGIESMPFKRVDSPPPTRFEYDNTQQVTIT
jgi:hypothetical protein